MYYATCPECNQVVNEDSLVEVEASKLCYHNRVCRECYDNLESDEG